jgi:hypothetical protein
VFIDYVETLLALNAIMPLLEVVHSLIKFVQLHDMSGSDVIVVDKICEGMYIKCIVKAIFVSKVMSLSTFMP